MQGCGFVFSLARWKANNYTSHNISLDSEGEQNNIETSDDEDTYDEDENDDEENGKTTEINYIVGDVTKPKVSNSQVAYIVHCVGE